MFKHFKNWFIPHKGNRHHPYLLRTHGLALTIGLVLVSQLVFNLVTAHRFKVLGYATDINVSDLLAGTNQERAAAGIGNLHLSSRLNQAAIDKAKDMFKYDYWAHVNPTTGAEPWYWFGLEGYKYLAAGENLAMDFATSSGVVDGWMNSGPHRANMLNGSYEDVGFAVVNGTLEGEETTLVVALYGDPQVLSASVASTGPSSTATNSTLTQASTPKSAAKPAHKSTKPPAAAPAPVSAPNVATQYSIIAPLPLADTLPWGEMAAIWLLGAVMVVSIFKHTAVWRLHKNKRRGIWLRTHPLLQASLLAAAIITLVSSSFGVVK